MFGLLTPFVLQIFAQLFPTPITTLAAGRAQDIPPAKSDWDKDIEISEFIPYPYPINVPPGVEVPEIGTVVTSPNPEHPLNQTTKVYNIHWYETIKIRMIFQKKLRVQGYPIRQMASIDYYSGLALWLPNNMRIDAQKTNEFWTNFPESATWRWVIVSPFLLENEPLEYALEPLLALPMGIGQLIGTVVEQIYEMGSAHYPVFVNLGFQSTMNDEIIKYNWDLIKDVLNDWGY